MPGGSERCLAARSSFVVADLRPWWDGQYTAEGSRLNLNFVCSIAPCTLVRELWAYKGRLPSHVAAAKAGSALPLPHKKRLERKQSALELP